MTRQFRRRRVAPAVLFALLAITGTASAAVVGLPADGRQVNDDPALGIDPTQDAGVSDVVGGSLAPAPRTSRGRRSSRRRAPRSRSSSARSRTGAGSPRACR